MSLINNLLFKNQNRCIPLPQIYFHFLQLFHKTCGSLCKYEIVSLAMQNGQPCPQGQQVLDHVLFLLGKDADRPSWNECPLLPRNIEEISKFEIEGRKKNKCNKRCLQEVGLLLKREFKETFRAKRQIVIELCVMLFTSMFVSSNLYNMCSSKKN